MIGVWFVQTSGVGALRIYRVTGVGSDTVRVQFLDGSPTARWFSRFTDDDATCCPTCNLLWGARRVP